MIAFVRGIYAGKTDQSVYIDAQGVGYELFVTQSCMSKLPAPGEALTLLSYLHVREDAMVLYGFIDEFEKSSFLKLIGVGGIGPKVALSALSYFSAQELSQAIANQDVARVSKIPGVGKKTAQRIILELKGSFDLPVQGQASIDDMNAGLVQQSRAIYEGVTEALLSMGFSSAETELALKDAPEGVSEQKLLQYALKRLGSA